jgi:hypothetical protein
MLLCLALACCSDKEDSTGNQIPKGPRISGAPTAVVSGSQTIFTGAVNPIGLETMCYFEYGATAGYGRYSTTMTIGNGTTDVIVRDTVQDLSVDSVYHCRLVAENSDGQARSPDLAFSVVAEWPTIVSVAAVTVSPGMAILSATVKANNLPTRCFVAYGVYDNSVYSLYDKVTPGNWIEGGRDAVVVCDTLANLGVDTTYHCRWSAVNSLGIVHASEQTFVITTGPPAISGGVAITYDGVNAILSATVRPNGLETTSYFEYGTTAEYGKTFPVKSIGSGKNNVVVTDTLPGPDPGITIHCRLVTQNSGGTRRSADREISIVPFVYPLTFGTQWSYRYTCDRLMLSYHGHGTQVWEVTEQPSSDSVRILVSRTDTISQYSWGDTVKVILSTTSITASIGQLAYFVRWFELTQAQYADPAYRENYFRQYATVPRYTNAGADTVSFGFESNDHVAEMARYVSGIGLISWRRLYNGHSATNETLTLESVTVAP